MKRRTAVAALALTFTAVLGTAIIRCDYSAIENKSYSYIPRERPRVFISHHPLRAMPGQTVTITLSPDLRPEDGGVRSGSASIVNANSGEVLTAPACAVNGATVACTSTLPGGPASYIYDGEVVLGNGGTLHSRRYLFRAAASIGANERLALREPVAPNHELGDHYRINTTWIRDAGAVDQVPYGEDTFLTDVERAVYEGILADPVYRWRDAQLAFYQYGAVGETTSYYSGFNTRCGQNPWPEAGSLFNTLSGTDVMAVMHRHPRTENGVEGSVTVTDVFRDCAGTAARDQNLHTFSATGTMPMVAKHEFGHAAFGLGDEYSESEATRRAPAGTAPTDNDCCCMPEDSGPGGVGGGGSGGGITGGGFSPRTLQPRCLGSNRHPSLIGLHTCSADHPLPSSCVATPQEACGPFESYCIVDRMWLGQAPPAGTARRPNVFPSREDCEASRTAALVHPGVEDAGTSAEPVCRQLCGGSTPCACGPAEAWIVDKASGAGPVTTGSATDTMGTVLAGRHGATCEWCVDTSLCVRWERARGRSADETWSSCQAPPLNAAENERSMTAWLRAWVDAFSEWLHG